MKIKKLTWRKIRTPVVFIVLLLIIIFAANGLFRRGAIDQVEEPSIDQMSKNYAERETPEITSYILRDKDLEGARSVLDRYLSSSSAEQASNLIHDRANEKNAFLKNYKPLNGVQEPHRKSALEYTDGSRAVIYFLPYGGGGKEVMLYAKPGEEFRLDWRSLFMCGDTTFQEYINNKPEGLHDIYCYVNADTYYSNTYAENVFQSLVLTDYESKKRISAYVRRGTNMDTILAENMHSSNFKLNNKTSIRAVLTVNLTGDNTRPSVEIIDVIATDWLDQIAGNK